MKKHVEYFQNSANLSRRAAALLAVGGAAAASYLGGIRATNALAAEIATDIKLTINWSGKPTDDELKVLQEIGYKHARAYLSDGFDMSVEQLKALKKRYADFGVSLDSLQYLQGGKGFQNMVNIMLNLPGRAQSIKNVQDWVRKNAAAGFNYVGGSFMLTGVWASERVDIRGGTISRRFDPTSPTVHGQNGQGFGEPGYVPPAPGLNTLYYGRPYGYDEIMSNFKKYWVKEIIPVLEESKVVFAFHPDDPPFFKSLGGLDRITNTYANLDKFFAACNESPNMQMMMCIGTWNEGGTELMGHSVEHVVREFWKKKRYQEVQFRSVSNGPINGVPHFDEVFMDSGEYDMYKVMKILVDNNYNGYMHLDHTPEMAGAPFTYAAYAAGFMRSCIVRAQKEPRASYS